MLIETQRMELRAIRGAITCKENTASAIEESVSELLSELVQRNHLKPEQIISIIFSVTGDINACFPASIARKRDGWDEIALLDCQQMAVKGDLSKCIRIIAHVWLRANQRAQHPYLGETGVLRPDR